MNRSRKKSKKSSNHRKIPLIYRLMFLGAFVLGLGLILFPVVSQYMYYEAAKVEVQNFKEEAEKLDNAEVNHRIELAKAYNSTIKPSLNGLIDPFSNLQEEGIKEYARMLEINEQIGSVYIPKISVEIPLYAGTVESVLQKGAGHLEGTSLPVGGASTHSVITAHRGLPSARLFTDLDKLEIGDVFYVQNIKETLAYRIDRVQVVEPNELEAIKIIPEEDRATLLTCTPYMINSHRLLVHGKRIPYDQAISEVPIGAHNRFSYRTLFLVTLTLLVIVLVLLFGRHLNQKRKLQSRRSTKI